MPTSSSWPTREMATRATAAAALVMAAADTAAHSGLIEDATARQVTESARVLNAAWRRACDGGRRDALTAYAEVAARAGADPNTAAADLYPTTDAAVITATTMALELLRTAATELATGVPGLLSDGPWLPPVSVTGRLASGYVCDSTVPYTLKVTALALLASLVPPDQRPGPAA